MRYPQTERTVSASEAAANLAAPGTVVGWREAGEVQLLCDEAGEHYLTGFIGQRRCRITRAADGSGDFVIHVGPRVYPTGDFVATL